MSWMVTHLYSDVSSCPTPGQRAARLSVARERPGVAGSGLETGRGALGASTFSVDTYLSTPAKRRSSSQSRCEILVQNTKIDRLTRALSASLIAPRPKVVCVGSEA